MTAEAQVSALIQQHRWALEEMYFDQRMQEINRFPEDGNELAFFSQFVNEQGENANRLFARYLEAANLPVPEGSTVLQVRLMRKQYPWLAAEVTRVGMTNAAVKNVQLPALVLYEYLHDKFTNTEILERLTWLIMIQRFRRKTIFRLEAGSRVR